MLLFFEKLQERVLPRLSRIICKFGTVGLKFLQLSGIRVFQKLPVKLWLEEEALLYG